MIDFHAHILPDFDDGPESLRESRALIEELISQGVKTIVSTSHFYPFKEGLDSFVRRRDEAFLEVKDFCQDLDVEFVKGAEVYCDDILVRMQDYSGIKIEGTQIILLELPFIGSTSNIVIKIIRHLTEKRSLIPMIAHIEKYPELRWFTEKKLRTLRELGCLFQINADSVVSKGFINKISNKVLKNRYTTVIGSDSHGLHYRPPRLTDALKVIGEIHGEATLDRLSDDAYKILHNDFNNKNRILL